MKKSLIALILGGTLAGVFGGAWWVKDAVLWEAEPYGRLTVAAGLVGQRQRVGRFVVELVGQEQPRLIVRAVETQQVSFASIPGRAFVAAAHSQDRFHEARGMASVRSQVLSRCTEQTLDGLEPDEGGIAFWGTLACPRGAARYRLSFRPGQGEDLVFDLRLTAGPTGLNRTYLIAASHAAEGFYGFGAQFTYFNQKGRRLPILVSEQGVGRGVQPLTLGADLTNDGAGGSWHTSYAGVPHYITSDNKSLMLQTHHYAVFDLRRDEAAIVELYADRMIGRLIAGQSPLALIENYTAIIGRMRPLPEWVTRGAIIGMQGGSDRVRQTLAKLEARGTPIAAFWLQDWVGQRRTSFGKQLWWNWTLDAKRYPGWPQLVAELGAKGIAVLTYINPFLVDVEERRGEQGESYRSLYKEAQARGYLVKRADGQPYLIKNTSFSAGLVDLTQPSARTWLKEVIKKELIGIGARGWMADFGEGFPFDGVTADPVDPLAHHNAYPELWAQLNREAIEEAQLGDSATFFSRSGYTRSPAYATLFWLGDQLVSWDQHDGIKTAVTGLLSSGISGFAFNHSDLGGYTTIRSPIKDYVRSKELELRWAELAAFSPVYRTHEGNRPDDNWQLDSDEETLAQFVRMAKVYACWQPYRRQLVTEAAQRGWPIVRHPYLHYPADPAFRRMDHQQFMVGADFMVVPVLDPGVSQVSAYLPAGSWVALWSGQELGPGLQRVAAPIGRPPVFFRQGSSAGQELRRCLGSQGLL